MPNYIYRCDKCNYIFEITHPIKEDYTDIKCSMVNKLDDQCKGRMKKIMSSIPFIFKKGNNNG